jgi:hypothetical protein
VVCPGVAGRGSKMFSFPKFVVAESLTSIGRLPKALVCLLSFRQRLFSEKKCRQEAYMAKEHGIANICRSEVYGAFTPRGAVRSKLADW